MKQVELPSGAVLTIHTAPFAVSKALYDAFLEAIKGMPVDFKADIPNTVKELSCYVITNKKVDACLWECMKRCTYKVGELSGDLKVEPSTFESVQSREDYMTVVMEVGMENILPFMKGLWREFQRLMELLAEGSQK